MNDFNWFAYAVEAGRRFEKSHAAQTFYVVKTHNDKYDTGEETYTSRQIKNARLFDDEDSAQAVANQYNPTARIVKVMVSEVET